MTEQQQHPITPPPELVEQWINEPGGLSAVHVATQAARWGADRRLEAVCEYIAEEGKWFATPQFRLAELRAAMDPKLPSSLKEQALTQLDSLHDVLKRTGLTPTPTPSAAHWSNSMTDLSPAAAGFDGAKGFRMPLRGKSFLVQLKRGKTAPSEHPDQDFKEQLAWFYPDDQPARLLWCNEDNQWFELSFSPIDKP